MTQIGKYKQFWIVTIIVLLLDQLTKFLILNNVEPETYISPEPIPVIKNWLYIVHIYNTGAAWGLFAGGSLWLALLAVVVIIAIFIFRKNLGLERPSMQFCIGLLLGGIVGNLIDRFYYGHVIDFIDVHLPGYRWPAFNIADSAIFLGIILYFILTFSNPSQSKAK